LVVFIRKATLSDFISQRSSFRKYCIRYCDPNLKSSAGLTILSTPLFNALNKERLIKPFERCLRLYFAGPCAGLLKQLWIFSWRLTKSIVVTSAEPTSIEKPTDLLKQLSIEKCAGRRNLDADSH